MRYDMNNAAMKIVILGWCGAFPRGGGACCGVLIRTSEGYVMVDCGSGTLSRFFQYTDVDELQVLLISHLHYDHMGDIGCLQYSINHAMRVGMRETKLPVYAPETPDNMWNAIQYYFQKLTPLSDGMEFDMAGMHITVRKVDHTIECYSFKFEKDGKSFVYFTDTTFQPDAADFIDGADLLLCEATNTVGSRHSVGAGHMSDLEAGRQALEGHAKKLCLFHLPSDVSLEKMRDNAESVYGKKVYMPYDQEAFYL